MYEMLNIPSHKGCVNCGECCGVIPANAAELAAIQKYLDSHPDVRALAVRQSGRLLDCPFRDEELRKCAIYPVRPMVCRLCGVTSGMQCPHGNSAEIDGNRFLENHGLNGVVLLNAEIWNT